MYIDGYNHKEKYVFTENHLRNVRANVQRTKNCFCVTGSRKQLRVCIYMEKTSKNGFH